MYYIKTKIKINKTRASEIIGVARPYITNILNGKIGCSKLVAYCITKYLNCNAEIEEYFYKKGE